MDYFSVGKTVDNYTRCPVCYHRQTLNDHDVCHNCGFEPGYDDANTSHIDLREKLSQDKNYFWFDLKDK